MPLFDRLSGAWDGFVGTLPAPSLLAKTHTRYDAHLARQFAREQREQLAQMSRAVKRAHGSQPFKLAGSGVRLSLADRFAVVGVTGSGKTTLTRELVNRLGELYPQAARYILDSKGEGIFDAEDGFVLSDEPPFPVGAGEQQVWQPLSNDRGHYETWFDRLLHAKGPAIIYVDELASIGDRHGQSFPLSYILLLKQGRALEKCVVSLTQEAAYIPRQTIGQTTHLIRMRLANKHDARELDEMMHGSPDPRREPATKYGFWYRRLDRPDLPQHFRDWREFLS